MRLIHLDKQIYKTEILIGGTMAKVTYQGFPKPEGKDPLTPLDLVQILILYGKGAIKALRIFQQISLKLFST